MKLTVMSSWAIALLACSVVHAQQENQQGDRQAPAIAAASDLQFALTEVANRFQRETGKAVRLTFGSSGNFVRQIEQGAPFELFFSADETFVERLTAKQLTRDAGALYAIGRIALFAPTGSPLKVDAQLNGLRALLTNNKPFKFSIANPEHAPYGRAAQQALEKSGLWNAIGSSLVLGENVSQAAQFATSGNTVGGIVAYSLVLAPAMKERGTYVLLPEQSHLPLKQRMVLLKSATPIAAEFYRYVQSEAARAILSQYGFATPKE